MMRRVFAVLLVWLLGASPGFALFNEAPLDDPAAEARATALMGDLRCLVCQNQSILDSNAPLARALRLLVRERVAAGDDDAAVLTFLVERYGDWVLLKPPFNSRTLVLWLAPAVLLALGLIIVVVWLRGRRRPVAAADADLSAEERRRLAALLDQPADDQASDRQTP